MVLEVACGSEHSLLLACKRNAGVDNAAGFTVLSFGKVLKPT